MNFKQIIEAWIIAGRPTHAQRELAEARGKICDECPSKKILIEGIEIATICGECGCPIGKKVFTNDYNPCDLKKWAEVDDKFFTKRKDNKSLI